MPELNRKRNTNPSYNRSEVSKTHAGCIRNGKDIAQESEYTVDDAVCADDVVGELVAELRRGEIVQLLNCLGCSTELYQLIVQGLAGHHDEA